MEKEELFALAYGFLLKGKILAIKPFGEGHINSTFLVETDEEKYILQKINSYVFQDVDTLMNNINKVSKFLFNHDQESLQIIPSKDGKLYREYEDEYYRVYVFVKDTVTYQKVGNDLSLVRSAGLSFGEFHYALKDFPIDEIKEVIPDFHNTSKRFTDFLFALLKADPIKKEEAKEEIQYILSKKDEYSLIYDALREGEIKKTVCHNDTKINNILFDKTTGKCRCVIDLDTVMPGTVLFDIGDAFRGMFTGDNEDNIDTSLLKVDADIYRAYIESYFVKMKNELNSKEKELIPFSIFLMTIECGMRFLEDYLKGNVYFHTEYETHNLVRARTQIALADDILKNIDLLKKITEEIDNA